MSLYAPSTTDIAAATSLFEDMLRGVIINGYSSKTASFDLADVRQLAEYLGIEVTKTVTVDVSISARVEVEVSLWNEDDIEHALTLENVEFSSDSDFPVTCNEYEITDASVID